MLKQNTLTNSTKYVKGILPTMGTSPDFFVRGIPQVVQQALSLISEPALPQWVHAE